MKNELLIMNYQKEILDLFKLHYKKMSTKDINLSFDSVLTAVFNELKIFDFEQSEIQFMKDWFNNIHNLAFIENILNKTVFEELIFHSHNFMQALLQGKKSIFECFNLTDEDYQLSFEIFALKNNIAWNFSEPFASFTATLFGNEYRVTLIHYSTSANKKSKVFIRSIQQNNPNLSLFNISAEMVELLKSMVKNKSNVLISGATGSGKTTFLRALLNEINPEEHVVVLEDTHEIMTLLPNQTSLLAKEEHLKKSLKDYCAYALRMSPDRMIVGEMRSTEVVPFMLAMNTGHRGLMSTVHSNSCMDALSRIALLFSLYSGNQEINYALITRLVCKNINYVIHMENKSIVEICRVIGSEGETPFVERIFSLVEGRAEFT